MSSNFIRLAMIGCGDVAQRDYLPEFHRLAGRAEIVAISGRTPERVRSVAQQYKIDSWYTDYEKMLVESDAEAVINLTPIQLHTETTIASLQAGKHVYTEKPVASSVQDAQHIRSIANRHHRILVCAPCVLLFPQVRFARNLVNDGAIGPIYSARAYAHMGVPPWRGYTSDPSPFFAQGAGPALDMGVYPLHTLTGIFGPARRAVALVSKVLDEFTVEDGPVRGKRVPIEAEDNWQMLLDFGQGMLASVAANSIAVASRAPQVELHGLEGAISLDPIDGSAPVEWRTKEGDWRTVPPPFLNNAGRGRRSGPDHHLGVAHLVDCIQNNHEPTLSIEHAIHVIEIVECCRRSSQTGHTVELTTTFPTQSGVT